MAASNPSEYEKPPMGNAGEASQMSWISAGVEDGAAVAASVVMVAVGSMHVAVRVICVIMAIAMAVFAVTMSM